MGSCIKLTLKKEIMIKKLARKILKDEIAAIEDRLAVMTSAARVLKGQNELLEDYMAPRKNFHIVPEKLTPEEQETIGHFVDTSILDLLSKWFRAQSDINNDFLVHSAGKTPEEQALWRAAILVYEDWNNFLLHCQNIYKRKENALLKAKEKNL